MTNQTLFPINLMLFDAGAAAGAAATGTTGGEATTGATQQPGVSPRAKEGGKVHYGRLPDTQQTQPGQAEPAPQQTPPDTQADTTKKTAQEKRKEFLELVESQYKDVYTQEFQKAFDRRFRQAKQTEESLERLQPLVDMLTQRYHLDQADPDKLIAALEEDESYWATQAEQAGMSVEQFKQVQRIQRQNAALNRQLEAQRRQAASQQQLEKWNSEAEQVQQSYPDFNLQNEVQNSQFLAMLRAGVPMKHAYEVSHLDDIKSGVAQQTAQKTEKSVVETIRAKGARPAENGVAAQSGITVKSDVSALTKKDRAEIARRVARGERISF